MDRRIDAPPPWLPPSRDGCISHTRPPAQIRTGSATPTSPYAQGPTSRGSGRFHTLTVPPLGPAAYGTRVSPLWAVSQGTSLDEPRPFHLRKPDRFGVSHQPTDPVRDRATARPQLRGVANAHVTDGGRFAPSRRECGPPSSRSNSSRTAPIPHVSRAVRVLVRNARQQHAEIGSVDRLDSGDEFDGGS